MQKQYITVAFSLLVVLFLVAPGTASAQDSHYWNMFYGTRATLMGGAVIGSKGDLSATYYNPGMLPISREQGLLLGASIYKLQNLTFEQLDLEPITSSRVIAAPSLVAGRLPVDSTVISGLAYSLFARQYFETTLENRAVSQSDVLGSDGIPEDLAREFTFNTSLAEWWAGLTAFHLLTPRIGIGLTNYVAIRTQSRRSEFSAQALTTTKELTSTALVNDFSFYHVRLLWKAGIGIDLSPLALGLTVTTPSIGLFGTGSVYGNLHYNGQSATGDTVFFAANLAEDVRSSYTSSWALGVGASYQIGQFELHGSLEWYAPVRRFTVLPAPQSASQSSGAPYDLTVTFELQSVLNGGIAIHYAPTPSISFYGSLASDVSGWVPSSASNLALTRWTLYHLTGGTVLTLQTVSITLGLSYASGNSELDPNLWSKNARALSASLGGANPGSVKTTSLTGIIALTFML